MIQINPQTNQLVTFTQSILQYYAALIFTSILSHQNYICSLNLTSHCHVQPCPSLLLFYVNVHNQLLIAMINILIFINKILGLCLIKSIFE